MVDKDRLSGKKGENIPYYEPFINKSVNIVSTMSVYIKVTLVIIIWSILLSVYSGNTTLMFSAHAQVSFEQDLNSLYSKALEAIEQDKYQEAIVYLDNVLDIDPDNVTALNKTGYSLNNLERYEEALGYYDKALAIEPNDTDVLDSNP